MTSAPSPAAVPDPMDAAPEAPPRALLPSLAKDQLEPEHVRTLYAQAPVMLFGYFLGAAALVLLFWSSTPAALLLGWWGVFMAILAVRLVGVLRFRRNRPRTREQYHHWWNMWALGTLASGAAWGTVVWLLWGRGTTPNQVALILIVYSYCVAAIPLLATQYRLFLAFALLCFAPMVLRIATAGGEHSLSLAGVIVVIFGMTVMMGTYFRATYDKVLALKVRTEQLAVQLQREKSAADEARQAAENANRAKTQFFSAASHDLRQPLHAMVLFAEALRQKNRDPDVAQLINSINDSVDALEGLFSELLDINRIDAGGVDVNPQHFGMKDLFARLKLHFEPAAFEKGLALTFRGARQYVYADPLLVERILRNLVSNAIRYSEDGGVLVSCRPRAGRICLQVWDTGIGISPEALPRIFEEFFQVQGTRQLQPHHRKGLGLGLAIVKRLADLMGASLTVRSEMGRGTVFTLMLPYGRAPVVDESTAVKLRNVPALALNGKRIVVVEDEPSVLDGLQVLLRSWGAEVFGFESMRAAQQWLVPEPPTPDLLIVDYRLPEGHNGVEAIKLLRGAFAREDLPAIVVTGSTMAGHEDEAQQENFHIMFKPVVPTKLRAMIAFKLGARSLAQTSA